MSVSSELLCSFELIKPLDSSALKNHIKKGRNKRNSMLNSPVSKLLLSSKTIFLTVTKACHSICAELLANFTAAVFARYIKSLARDYSYECNTEIRGFCFRCFMCHSKHRAKGLLAQCIMYRRVRRVHSLK